jgi:hypothetical protein
MSFLGEIFFLRNKIEEKLPVGIAERCFNLSCVLYGQKSVENLQFFLFLLCFLIFLNFDFETRFMNFLPLEPYLKIFV